MAAAERRERPETGMTPWERTGGRNPFRSVAVDSLKCLALPHLSPVFQRRWMRRRRAGDSSHEAADSCQTRHRYAQRHRASRGCTTGSNPLAKKSRNQRTSRSANERYPKLSHPSVCSSPFPETSSTISPVFPTHQRI